MAVLRSREFNDDLPYPEDSRFVFIIYREEEPISLTEQEAVSELLDNTNVMVYENSDNGTPLTVVVPEQGEAEVTVELRHAHVKLDITVERYGLVTRSDATGPLRIEVSDLTSLYGFDMNAHFRAVQAFKYIGEQ